MNEEQETRGEIRQLSNELRAELIRQLCTEFAFDEDDLRSAIRDEIKREILEEDLAEDAASQKLMVCGTIFGHMLITNPA